jgi:mannose-6-phosphate isomerase-like protein (cupin superfamily)
LSPPDENIPDGAIADSVGDARSLTGTLDTTGLSMNYYGLVPGENFTVSSHRHSVQEELFYIQSGTATFETEITVNAGEVLRLRRVRFSSEPTTEMNESQRSLSTVFGTMSRLFD